MTTVELHGQQVRVEGYDPDEVAGGLARAAVPFNDLVGLVWDLVSPERVELHLDVEPRHHQPAGAVHGGVYCTLVEAAGSSASVARVAADGLFAVGVHNATSFLRSVADGRLTAVATPVHLGRTQHLWEVRITRADGELAAKGELRTAIVRPRDDG